MRIAFVLTALVLFFGVPCYAFDFHQTSVGAYAGVYLLECPAINNNVLCVNGDPALGAAPIFGGEIRLLLPKNIFLEINLGYSVQRTVASIPDWPKDSLATEGKLEVVPLALTVGRHMQLMPKLWGSAGLTAGYALATLDIDTLANRSDGTRFTSHHAGRGGGLFLGLLLGIDLKLHRHIDLSVNLSYRFGDIGHLTVRESDDPTRIGNTLKYFDTSSHLSLPLPVEISTPLLCYTLKYNF